MVTFDKTGTLTKGQFQVVDCQVGCRHVFHCLLMHICYGMHAC